MTSLRILHAVGGMERAGIETWLMHVLRRIDRSQFQFDFLVHTDRSCAYDDEIRSLGSRIIPCPHPHQPWRYIREVRRALHEFGPYDVVHSHLHHFSGLVLRLARQFNVPQRIAHSHTAPAGEKTAFLRKLYLRYSKGMLRREATVGLAASEAAAIDLYGPNWTTDPRWRILPCGIDLARFTAYPRDEVRTELGLTADDFVIGHVGRFDAVKNHRFLLEVARALLRLKQNTRLLLVGDGVLRADIEAKAHQQEIPFICTGSRADVPRLLSAMDAFVFPSIFEGLPMSVVEAQAAGLPVLISTGVPAEASVVPGSVLRIPLDAGAQAWAEAVQNHQRPDRQRCLDKVTASRFNLAANLDHLLALYEQVRT